MKKSDRTARLAQSDIRAMTLACAKVNGINMSQGAVSYTHLRAHETVLDLVCRLLLEKKKHKNHVAS